MSYVKLFSSILDSTIWLEADHVVRVWIAMLAMKDEYGVVAAAVPGLAARSRVTVPECEEALAKFLGPDPYSSTPDHEGRRIEVVDGGWRVLNHDKYRDKQSREEQREKTAARVAKHRALRKAAPYVTPDVTLGNGVKRDVTEVTPSDQIRSDQIGRERPAQDVTPVTPSTPLPARQKLNHDVWQEAKLAHDLSRSKGLDPGARAWSAMPAGEGGNDLAARTRELLELGDEAFARAQHRHVIDLRIAEAVELGSLAYVIPSRMFAKASFSKALELSIEQAIEQARERKRRDRRAAGAPDGASQIRIVRDDDAPPAGLEDL